MQKFSYVHIVACYFPLGIGITAHLVEHKNSWQSRTTRILPALQNNTSLETAQGFSWGLGPLSRFKLLTSATQRHGLSMLRFNLAALRSKAIKPIRGPITIPTSSAPIKKRDAGSSDVCQPKKANDVGCWFSRTNTTMTKMTARAHTTSTPRLKARICTPHTLRIQRLLPRLH